MAAPPRLYHRFPQGSAEEVAPTVLELSREQLHHLVHVLRLGVGDAFEVFDGKGRVFSARVSAIESDRATATLGTPYQLALPLHVTLLQALPKADKLEWVIQKGTELGASAFVAFPSARSVAKLPPERSGAKGDRWRKIAEEAARQSRRADLPEVHLTDSLRQAVSALPPGTEVWILDEEERALRLHAAFEARPDPSAPLALAVGPEGGWSREEVAQSGALAVGLGPRILRTETAALAALAITLHRAGELG